MHTPVPEPVPPDPAAQAGRRDNAAPQLLAEQAAPIGDEARQDVPPPRKKPGRRLMAGVNLAVLGHLCLVYFALSSVIYLVSHRPPSTSRAGTHPRTPYPPLHFQPATFLVGRDPAPGAPTWRFNSRALSLVSTMCVQPATRGAPVPSLHFAAEPKRPSCTHAHADFAPARPVDAARCAPFMRERVLCPHGRTHRFTGPRCPTLRPLDGVGASSALFSGLWPFVTPSRPHWLRATEVAVVVPDLSFARNIFHFAFQIAQISDAVTALPALLQSARERDGANDPADYALPSGVHVVLQGAHPARLGRWQLEILRAQLNGVAHESGLRVRLTALNGTLERVVRRAAARPLCARRALLLGARGDLYLWPFANDSAVPSPNAGFAPPSVPASALAFRRRAYDAFGIRTALPRAVTPPRTAVLEAPPLSVLYARRATFDDVAVGTFKRGQWRRLSAADEEWLLDTVRAEALRVNASVRVIEAGTRMAVRSQVEAFSGAGLVVGLHGANLVNAMFVRPLGALLELFPGGLRSPCYVAGMNSGLAYMGHEAAFASAWDSHCPRNSYCWRLPQHRRVRIDDDAQRAAVRAKVRDGLAYLARLRRTFPAGVPVRYVAGEGAYVIDEARARG